MTVLESEIVATLAPGMTIPAPLRLLFDWIEANGFFNDQIADQEGRRVGYLFPQAEEIAGWTDTEKPGGTHIEFVAEGNVHLHHWFGHERREVIDRVCVFAKTGADGSMAAFWLDDTGAQKIVHLGSGSGSTLVCVLADDPIDFLRLLAIGYDEICWSAEWAAPPNANLEDEGVFVHPNLAYQAWVRDTFSVELPATAADIVKHPSRMGDTNSADPFWRWVDLNT